MAGRRNAELGNVGIRNSLRKGKKAIGKRGNKRKDWKEGKGKELENEEVVWA